MPVLEKEVVAALPPQGWLRRYVIHAAKQTTAPLVYHLGVGISLLGVTCPLNYGMHYAGPLRSNQFALLVGRSGEDNKSAALRVGKSILDAAAPPLVGDFPGSAEGLVDSLQRVPSQLIPISEFGKFLASAQKGYFEPIKTLLADVWDCFRDSTEVLAESGWKKFSELSVGEKVWALDAETDTLVLSRVEDIGSRPVRAGERLVQLKGHNHDICTTEGHRYYIKYRDPKRNYAPSSNYMVKTGKEMVERRSSFYLPFSAPSPVDTEGVALTDDELRFIAWFITDGSRPRPSTVAIYQSTQAVERVARIRDLLSRLGFDWNEVSDKAGSYKPNGANMLHFRVPKGTHRGVMQRAGWGYLEQYLDKDLSVALLQMNRRQFKLFWEELLQGDGEQKERGAAGLLWTVRKTLVDRLQHLAVVHGFSTQYGTRELPSGKIAYRMSVTTMRHVCTDPGNKKSIRFEYVDPNPGEIVWCATTEHGTLVTRNNGKVVILGNCDPLQRAKANNKIVRVETPRLSIAAACSIPYLEKHTLAEDWTGGFMGRWLVLYGKRERVDPDPTGDNTDFAWLSDELKRRAMIPNAGWCVGLDRMAAQYWADWYDEISHRQLPGNIIGIRARAPTLARKIALAYAWDFGPAQAGQPWTIDLTTIDLAVRAAELHVKSLIHLSDVIAEHEDARLRRAVLVAIDEKGGSASLGEILSLLKRRKRHIVETLDGLIEEGRVSREDTTLGKVYVHRAINGFAHF